MRSVSMGVAAAAILFAAPAFAADGGFYAGLDLGAAISAESDQVYTPGGLAGSTGHVTTDHDLGFSVSGVLGYDFGWVRVELEAGYLTAGVDKVTSDFATGSGLAIGSQSAGGDIMARSVMANVMVDIGAAGDFTFFVGGGAGAAKLNFSGIELASGPVLLDDEDRDWRFAWQGMAGVRKPLSDRTDIHVRYRYVDISDAELIGLGGRVVEAGFSAHVLSAGITFNF